jgi:hypothetical protein
MVIRHIRIFLNISIEIRNQKFHPKKSKLQHRVFDTLSFTRRYLGKNYDKLNADNGDN